MKLALNLLVGALLLATVPAVSAAEEANSTDLEITRQSQVALPESLGAEALATPGESCGAEGQPLLSVDGQGTLPTSTLFCGSCSTGGCAGASQGTLCYLGSRGFGNCNYAYGALLCADGGLNCRCWSGPLP